MKLSWFAVAIAAVVSCLNVHAQVTWHVDSKTAEDATAGFRPLDGHPSNIIKTVIQDAIAAAASGTTVGLPGGNDGGDFRTVLGLRGACA